MSIPKRQEPKYDCGVDGVFNRQSEFLIPAEEPIFIFRARDRHAIAVLEHYKLLIIDDHHEEVVQARINQFKEFKRTYPERMKEPDTDTTIFTPDSKDQKP
jgi:hypothetical protein